ncbi:MAG TPA: N-acetylglucosamine kinase [Flavobacteriaceae bacterium]|nr:N-acetylglucosamine kinase [Flavobacteriaceae bacterium]
MILLADGGSTKCDWIFLGSNGEELGRARTKGLNPAVFTTEVLKARLLESQELSAIKNSVEAVHFYGAGCGTATPTKRLFSVLEEFFPKNCKVQVAEDMVAAVHAVTTEPGIVCILGTGSNSCYFDGKEIHMEVASLGYTLMDEASGNYFGKRLIRDYFYKKMPSNLAESFNRKYDLNPDHIKENLYKKENPNSYLASFAEFIFTNEKNGYFYKLISDGMQDFIEHRVLCYKEAQNVPVHFIGSIAFFSQDIIRDAAKPYHLKIGNVIQRPIDGLITYYRNKILQN